MFELKNTFYSVVKNLSTKISCHIKKTSQKAMSQLLLNKFTLSLNYSTDNVLGCIISGLLPIYIGPLLLV